MHGVRRVRIRGVDEAEDLALVLADPVAQVLHAVALLSQQVGRDERAAARGPVVAEPRPDLDVIGHPRDEDADQRGLAHVGLTAEEHQAPG